MVKNANGHARWMASDIPLQTGRRIVITGTGGLAYECALALARAGGEVILAGRNTRKGAESIAEIRQNLASADIRFEQVDLTDLASVEAFGRRMRDTCDRLDLLISNAAVMSLPHRQVTKDGFEMHFGTNHLGHFALTAHLLPLLRKGKEPRIVTVCAGAANGQTIKFGDLQSEHGYKPFSVYGHSKLANLIFSQELHRRSMAANWGVKSIAAHPGLTRSDLAGGAKGEHTPPLIVRLLGPVLCQPADRGALPTLFAATAPQAQSGGYYGPDGWKEIGGFPAPAKIVDQAKDPAVAKRLWEVSEQLTHVTFGESG